MYNGCCRIGDIVVGVCQADDDDHPRNFTGTWITGASDVTSNGIGMVRIGDIGVTDCNHTFMAIDGAPDVTTNTLAQVSVGSPVVVLQGGYGIAVTGASDVIST